MSSASDTFELTSGGDEDLFEDMIHPHMDDHTARMAEGSRGAVSTLRSEPIEGLELIETGTVAADRSLYERFFWDLNQADRELDVERIDYANLIHASAHLRLVIEEVTIASFVASHLLISEAGRSFRTTDSYDSALKKLNGNYWPVAFVPIVEGEIQEAGVLPSVGLQESDIGRYFGSVSKALHVQPPYV